MFYTVPSLPPRSTVVVVENTKHMGVHQPKLTASQKAAAFVCATQRTAQALADTDFVKDALTSLPPSDQDVSQPLSPGERKIAQTIVNGMDDGVTIYYKSLGL